MSAGDLQEGSSLEELICRSCVTCYATAGTYPQTLDYLQENYGVPVDERYTVDHKAIA